MKRNRCKLMLALVAGLALGACAELDMEGRGRVALPPVIVPGPTVYEPGHADDRDDEYKEKHKHKHKHKKKDKKEKDEGDDDDDDDGDDRNHGKHHKD